MSVNEKMTAIADAIRDKTKGIESLSLDDMAAEIPKVFEKGKKAEYDAFWDVLQSKGTRVNYGNAFGGVGWTDTLFKPKYDICPTDGYMMFRGTSITDLTNLPVKLDFSNCTNFQYMFQWANVKYIGVLDTRKATNVSNPFYYATALITIDKLILKDDGTQNLDSNIFGNANALKNITIEGKFGKTLTFAQSTKLSKASIESIINALSTTTSGLTVTLSEVAVNNAFTAEEWQALTDTKTNWTISLV